MAEKELVCIDYSPYFYGAGSPAAAGSPNGIPFTKRDTSEAGAPTLVGVAGGGWALAMDNTNEVQVIGFDTNDVLGFDIDDLVRVEWRAKVDTTPAASVTMLMGVGSAYNATADSVSANAWFRLQGSAALLAESDDGTNDNDDKATGISLSTTYKRFAIDFATGILTKSPPNASVGGKGNVLFYVEDTLGHLTQVAKTTGFDMSNYSSGLQPYFQVQKTAATATGTLTIKDLKVWVKGN